MYAATDGLDSNRDGIVGMGQTSSDNVLYVPELFKSNVISENVFSFLITGDAGTTGNSYIDFGTPNTSVMSSVSDLVWIDSTNVGGWWTSNVHGWRYTGSSEEIGLPEYYGLTDTGSSCILGPEYPIDTIKAAAYQTITGSTY